MMILLSNKPIDTNDQHVITYADNQQLITYADNEDVPLKEVISPNLFGTPSEYVKDKHIIWEFQDPKPWSKIIYKNNDHYPFYFFIKIKIPSLNDYQSWKNIIPN